MTKIFDIKKIFKKNDKNKVFFSNVINYNNKFIYSGKIIGDKLITSYKGNAFFLNNLNKKVYDIFQSLVYYHNEIDINKNFENEIKKFYTYFENSDLYNNKKNIKLTFLGKELKNKQEQGNII